ncbi:tetratricopeptide repeat protein [Candidatus Sumerlaeota bacterium]|nr:tetratricopeptide repeat protein [Candidatus Sumerlaeota bacterium]
MASTRRKPGKNPKSPSSGKGKRMNSGPPIGGPPRLPATEQLHRILAKMMEGKDFKTVGEMNAFLEAEVNGRNLDELMEGLEPSDTERAQELALEAMATEDPAEFLGLVASALELDPNNMDALTMGAELLSPKLEILIENFRMILRSAEDRLGQRYFEEMKGHFWGYLETRPYMRCKATLARTLTEAGRANEAITEYEQMLVLNPNDNQGIRDLLLGLYLMAGKVEEARGLIERYKKDTMAAFMWGRVLERFLSGDLPGAAKARKAAEKQNPYVRDYLIGKKPLPKKQPEYYGFGDRNEAHVYHIDQGAAWNAHPAALEWLKT